jgi:hypothetical protein
MDDAVNRQTASFRAVLSLCWAAITGALAAALQALLWSVITSMLVVRPLLSLVLIPVGSLMLLMVLIVGFLAEARPIYEHRWPLLMIGLGSIALMQIYDSLIRMLEAARGNDGSHHS